ncbi:MAG: TonB-dependent receptor [Nitrospirae bacterium]|nr:MAG: TonB-dependent receptor [Nitrospirota bacterium]
MDALRYIFDFRYVLLVTTFTLTLAGIGPLSLSFAQTHEISETDEVPTLQEIVVSATKTPVPVTQVTSAVEVFTEEDFKRRRIKTVLDVLRLGQGIAAFQNGGPGTNATVRIRGGNANQTLVLIDGAIVNSATLGSFNFGHLTVDNIEKIEIVRGAQSTLWGADAMGGVITITTKRGHGPFRAGGFYEYGSFNTLREGISMSGQKGPFDLSLTLSRWDTSSISAINFRRGASERDPYRNWQASSRLGIKLPHDGRMDLNFRWWNGSLNIDSSVGPSDVIKARNNSNQLIFSGIYEQPITDWWTHVLTVSRAQEASLFDPGISQRNLTTGAVSVPFGSPNETRVLANRIESQHNFYLAPYATLTLGYQFREQQGENDTGLSTKIISSHAGFAQVQVNLWDRFFGTAGVRHDSFNVFGGATTYRVTAGYLVKETDTKIRSSYATGFRAPTINDLFFPNFGNPNVQPEKSQSFDVGIDQFFFEKRVRLSGGYFWNRFRDLIQTIQSATICGVGSFGANFCPVNVATAKTQGWEGSLAVTIVQDYPWIKRLEVRGQYTMTLTRNLNTTRRLARWPVDQASVSVYYQPIDPLSFLLDFRFVGSQFNLPSTAQNDSQRVGSFEVVNLTTTYEISKQLRAYVRAENIFDERYEEVLFFGTPGRSIYGGVRMNFEIPFFIHSPEEDHA